jgi:hypothetical protein
LKHLRILQPAHLACLIVIGASLCIVSTYKVLSHTSDEPAHLAAGIEWIDGGSYTYEDLHPPLARVLGAAGLHAVGGRWGRLPEMYDEGYRLVTAGRYWRNLFYSRLAMLPLFWIGAAVVFLWTRRISSSRAAVLATLIFCTLPPILGHAGLVTTDMALTAFTGAAALSFLRLLDEPRWRNALWFGALTGLAALSKFSALVFLPLAFSGFIALRRGRIAPRALVRLCIASLPVAFLVIWAGYRFSLGPWPAPAFFSGIRTVMAHNAYGHLSYLLGERSQTGFWYYYPVVLAVKTPVAALALFGAFLWLLSRKRFASASRSAEALVFAAAILVVGLFSHINIGVRHILPLYLGLAVCCGIAAAHLTPRYTWAVTALLAWQAIGGAISHPDYIAYTNELAGSRPERILADSDLDWGQGMRRLATRLRELHVKKLSCRLQSLIYLGSGDQFPEIVQMPEGDVPPKGWSALSITTWKLTGQPLWADRIAPTERIGKSILLYYIPE